MGNNRWNNGTIARTMTGTMGGWNTAWNNGGVTAVTMGNNECNN